MSLCTSNLLRITYVIHYNRMKEEILPLNALRFLAALAVLCVHFFVTLIDRGYLPHFLSFLNPYTEYGYLGVNLFFLISGFVISLSSEGRTFGQFISARFIRLFPVFWLCVSITTLFTFLLTQERISIFQYLANLTMMPDLYGNYAFIDGSYWTLGIELRFYFAIACIVLIRTYIPLSLEKIALFLTPPVVYLAFFFNPYHISSIENIFLNILYYFGSEYAQFFIAGILFYELYNGRRNLFIYGALFLCYIVAACVALDHAYVSNKPEIILLHVTAFFGLFLAVSLKKITNTSFSFLGKHHRKILTVLGAITYPIYLLHSKIIHIFIETMMQYKIPTYLASPLLFCSFIFLIYMVNAFDTKIRTYWKKSSIIKTILERNSYLWIKKV